MDLILAAVKIYIVYVLEKQIGKQIIYEYTRLGFI